ncbi:hypothetical protein [Bdellovibrio sp. HCB337]|uniref:hypothetical protein n=1 Tax=Bdellovibrio sp. HCB337 TaxID=3394358 RepID=UPI0039A5EB73
MIKILAIFFTSVGFYTSTFAAETCITTPQELVAKKASFPQFLQASPPVMFTRSDFPVAAIKFSIEGDKIVGESVHRALLGKKTSRGYVKRMCYEAPIIKIDLEIPDGDETEEKKLEVAVVSDTAVKISGYLLKKSTPAEFAAVMNKLNQQENSTSTATTYSAPARTAPHKPTSGRN